MAKKTTRKRKQIAQQRAIEQAAANVSMATARPSAPAPKATPETAAARVSVDLSDEYKYVRTDLRRIAILATSIVAVLVALSFVIR